MSNPIPYEAPPRDGILSIEFAAANGRARRVVSRSNTHPTGRFPSARMGRMIHWDSIAELNAYRLFEANPAVLGYQDQPCVIYYRLAGEIYRHYPDCLAWTATTKALHEIKHAEDAREPAIAARTQLLARCLPAWGFEYSVLLAEDLRRQPRLRNVCLLLRHGRRPLTFVEKEQARRLLLPVKAVRWAEVVAGRHAPFTLQHACRLVLEGALAVDLDAPLDAAAQLTKVAQAPLFGG